MNSPRLAGMLLVISTVAAGVVLGRREIRQIRLLAAQLAGERVEAAQLNAAQAEVAGKTAALAQRKTAAAQKLEDLDGKLSVPARRALAVERARLDLLAQRGGLPPESPGIKDTFFAPVHNLQRAFFPELLSDPAYSRAVNVMETERIDAAYSRFFAAQHLDAATQSALESLLVQRRMAGQDIEGMPLDADEQSVMRQASATETAGNMAQLIGTDGVAALQAYDKTAPLYDAVASMQTRLGAGTNALSADQATQLLSLLTTGVHPGTTRAWTMPDSVMQQAASVLTPPQLAMLEQIQSEQDAEVVTKSAHKPR